MVDEVIEDVLSKVTAPDGRSYRSFISPTTQIGTNVVGRMDFADNARLYVRAMFWWRLEWGQEPRIDDVRFTQLPFWPDLKGALVAQWAPGAEPEPTPPS